MPQFLAPIINDQQIDANGDPLSGGKVFVYLAGSSTPVATYSDKAGLVPNSFPITLNSLGLNAQGAVWLTGGVAYKYVIQNAALVTQRTLDNISGIGDTASTASQWEVYQAAPTYISATSFSVAGDQTSVFSFGTRVRSITTGGTVYSTVVRSAYSANTTTVTLINESASLDSGLSVVSTGIITASNTSLPGTLNRPSFRNRILNSRLFLDSRNGASAQTITSGAAIAYTVDRFYASCTGANVTTQQIAGTGYTKALRFTGAASNTQTLFGQRIESVNTIDWIGKQVNVQVPISSTSITSLTWNAYVANTTDTFSAKTLLATGTLAISSTVETKFFSFNAGANADRGIAIEFVSGALLAGQTLTYQGAIQAEADQLSTFEVVDIITEFNRCQRYFETGTAGQYGYGLAGTTNGYRVPFKTAKRTTPTMAYAATTATNVSTFDAINPDTFSFLWRSVNTATAAFVWDGTWNASAEL